jgi:hypothetical protein
MKTERDQELLLYWSGELGDESRKRLEEEIAGEAELRERFDVLRQLESHVLALPDRSPRIDLVSTALDQATKPGRRFPRPAWLLPLGPAFAVLMVALLVAYPRNQEPGTAGHGTVTPPLAATPTNHQIEMSIAALRSRVEGLPRSRLSVRWAGGTRVVAARGGEVSRRIDRLHERASRLQRRLARPGHRHSGKHIQSEKGAA